MKQQVEVNGVGIHTGVSSCVTLHASDEKGIRIHTPRGTVPLLASLVTDTARCTILRCGDASISTVEHFLAACTALGVSALDVYIDSDELPIGDGACGFWMDALQTLEAGSGAPHWQPIPHAIEVFGENGAFIGVYPSQNPTISVLIQFPDDVVGTMAARWDTKVSTFRETVASARTFGFRSEIEQLLAAGLGRGGSLENCIIVEGTEYAAPLRMPNEPAMHKLLDLVGDLGLCGCLPLADVIAVRPSHKLNVDVSRRLTTMWEK